MTGTENTKRRGWPVFRDLSDEGVKDGSELEMFWSECDKARSRNRSMGARMRFVRKLDRSLQLKCILDDLERTLGERSACSA